MSLPPLPTRKHGVPVNPQRMLAQLGLEEVPPPLSPSGKTGRSNPDSSSLAEARGEGPVRRDASDITAKEAGADDSIETKSRSRTAPSARSDSTVAKGISRSAADSVILPPMPGPKRTKVTWLVASFFLCVVAPLIAVGVYLFAFASDQYVAEFRFSVTETNPITLNGGAPAQPNAAAAAASAASALLGGAAMTTASPQNFVVVDYLKSRQVVDELQKRIHLRDLFTRPEIDWWQRFPSDGPVEKLVDYWSSNVVSANFDPVTGLAIAKVKAYTPADALQITQNLVTLSEELVNTIALRTQLDAVKFAESEVAKAQARLKDVRLRLLEFRTAEGVIDPTTGVVPTNVALVQQLRANLIQAQTDLAALRGQKLESNAAAAQAIIARISATKDQLARVEKEVAKDREGARALAEIMAKYEALDLDRQYAQTLLVNALQAYDQARASAAAQHLYLTPYVRPTLPESSTYPRRTLFLVLAAAALLAIWLGGLVLYRSVRDHAL